MLNSCRRIDNQQNIFEGVHRNWFFIGINALMIACQLIVMFFGGAAFSITRLNGSQWAYSLVLGALSLPVGAILRLLPLEGMSLNMRLPWRKRIAEGDEFDRV
jgi:P-type Ca2+ transporter type 2C